MRKIIAIGESVLDILFRKDQPAKAQVGGRIANAAAIAADMGVPCAMVSECCADRVGDIIVDYLTRHHVDVSAIDRYKGGSTALSTIFDDDQQAIINYGTYPDSRFNVVWPRIDENDILIFGSLYSIEEAQRERLYELVTYAAERHAIIIYLPGFQHGISYRITHVMPAILENLETAHLVIAHDRDLHDIFPGESAQQAFANHVEFYCNHYLHIHNSLAVTHFTAGGHNEQHYPATSISEAHNLLGWQAGFTAGVAIALILNGVTHDSLDTLSADTWHNIVGTAQHVAALCADGNNCLSDEQAGRYRQLMQSINNPIDQ